MGTEKFIIDNLLTIDAFDLSVLMVQNSSRFQRDFPQTLAQNLTTQASTEYIRRKQKENASRTEFTWAIRDNETNHVAGLIILKELDWEKGSGEFAYCIGKTFEGRGWISKTVQELTMYAFNELGLATLQIIAHETNTASIKVAEKCGYRWQKKLLKSHTPPDGIALDMQLYERYTSFNEYH